MRASKGILHTRAARLVKRVVIVCKIPLLERALGLKARSSARATIGYLVYKCGIKTDGLHDTKSTKAHTSLIDTL